MSFSSEVKEELSKINNLKNKKEVAYELIGYLITANTEETEKYIKFSTENQYNINRLNKLLNNLNIDYDIRMQGNLYVIKLEKEAVINIKNEKMNDLLNSKVDENFVKAFVRGAFLGSGSINNPHKLYHLEIVLQTKEYALIIKKLCNDMNINLKGLKRKTTYSLYIKEGEEISKFLAYAGAQKSVIKFEEIRVIKEMRNDINRKVNCETANLNKTVSAAVRQIEDIKLIQDKGVKLPDSLVEIASLRIENPDSSLIELGNMLSTPIGKSGVNHRLKKIQEIANSLRKSL